MHKKVVGLAVLAAVVTQSGSFWDITPGSPLKVNRRFGGTYRLHLQGRRISRSRKQQSLPPALKLVSCSAYSSTLKMEAICCSETSVYFQRTTRRHAPGDSTLHKNVGQEIFTNGRNSREMGTNASANRDEAGIRNWIPFVGGRRGSSSGTLKEMNLLSAYELL
jgi:hypothetical protein